MLDGYTIEITGLDVAKEHGECGSAESSYCAHMIINKEDTDYLIEQRFVLMLTKWQYAALVDYIECVNKAATILSSGYGGTA